MFTGLIETTGRMLALHRRGEGAMLEVSAPLPVKEIAVGDSIAVNGVCLTVVGMQGTRFKFDVSPETVERTTFGLLQPGSAVNLERALKFGSRLDGHLVTGHIDCVGRFESRVARGNSVVIRFSASQEYLRLLVEKGSVALDGISLTVNSVTDSDFSVSIIPHTLSHTTLAEAVTGTAVNIETDIIGKYVARFVAPHTGSRGIGLDMLIKNGFV